MNIDGHKGCENSVDVASRSSSLTFTDGVANAMINSFLDDSSAQSLPSSDRESTSELDSHTFEGPQSGCAESMSEERGISEQNSPSQRRISIDSRSLECKVGTDNTNNAARVDSECFSATNDKHIELTTRDSPRQGQVDGLPELQEREYHPLQDLTFPTVTPPSPSTLRSLTPPFPDEPDTSDSVKHNARLGSSVDGFAAFLGSPGPAYDMRRHSSAALSPIEPTEEAMPRQFPQFPQQRCYSLVDMGPIPSLVPGRQSMLVQPIPRRPRIPHNASDTGSSRTSRSGSRPASARFSTFEEMGIQSFAMAKGGKAVDLTKKERENRKLAKAKRKNGDAANGSTGSSPEIPMDATTKEKNGSSDGETRCEQETTETILTSAGEAEKGDGKRKRRADSRVKDRGCIIM